MKATRVICLFLAALIWGFAFVAQSVGMDYIGPFTFNGIRCVMGGAVLIPVALIAVRAERRREPEKRRKTDIRTVLAGGLCCGCIMFAATSLQQIALLTAQAGKAGFLTAMYVVLVPLISVFIGKKIQKKIWICVGMSVCGMYLLCVSGRMSLGREDLLLILCALIFALHILAVDYFVERMNGVVLSCLQFLIAGGISIVLMFLLEDPDPQAILRAKSTLLYTGLLSCGAGYTFQILGQKGVHPTFASLIMSLESVFSVIGGWLILHESLSPREITGCVIMFAAIVIAQVPVEKYFARGRGE